MDHFSHQILMLSKIHSTHIDQCCSSNVIRDALESELEGMAKQSGMVRISNHLQQLFSHLREIARSFLMLRLLFCEEPRKRYNISVDLL